MSNRRKILCVFGTRPEAIKMAPVVIALKRDKKHFMTRVVVTAQHRQMLDQVMKLFRIKPDYDLNIMLEAQTLYQITSKAIIRLKPILDREKPDLVLVHGDTTTTFASSLACFYAKIPVGHVEAGLRTFDPLNPYPEETNRILTDHIASIHFAPTVTSRRNLIKEGIGGNRIFVTGNPVIDALHWVVRSSTKSHNTILKNILRSDKRVILVTAHRRENWGKPLEDICKAIRQIVKEFKDVEIAYPVHPNPNVTSTVNRLLGSRDRIQLMPPLDYLDFASLYEKCHLILTDSGGLQEEGPSLGKPVLVMRKITERPEAVRAGTVKMVGRQTNRIVRETSILLKSSKIYNRMANTINPYGDGKTGLRIVEALQYFFGMRRNRPRDFGSGTRRY